MSKLSLVFGFLFLLQASGQTREYHNERWGFCFSYPSGWSKDEGVDKAGIRLTAPAGSPLASTTVAVGALPDQPRGIINADPDDTTPMTLEENVSDYLKDSDAHRSQQVAENTPTKLLGVAAVSTVIRYSNSYGSWVEKRVWALRAGTVYTISLQTRPAQFETGDRIFQSVISTFRFDCGSKR